MGLYLRKMFHAKTLITKTGYVKHFLSIILVWGSCILSSSIFSMNCGFSNVHIVDTFDLLRQEARTLDKEDLVIFDVDGVLLIEEDAIFGVKAENKVVWQQFFRPRLRSLSPEEVKYIYSIVRQQCTCSLVDATVVQLIINLQEKGVKTIALTGIKTGCYGVIEKFEDWRFNQLKMKGIDFSISFALDEPLMLFPQEACAAHSLNTTNIPVFAKKGIVFAGEYSKGYVLKFFLKAIKWQPKRIVFVDDDKKCLESVAQACLELGIKFIGLLYVGAEKICKPIDQSVAGFQVDYFFEHKEWLSDQQALGLMCRGR